MNILKGTLIEEINSGKQLVVEQDYTAEPELGFDFLATYTHPAGTTPTGAIIHSNRGFQLTDEGTVWRRLKKQQDLLENTINETQDKMHKIIDEVFFTKLQRVAELAALQGEYILSDIIQSVSLENLSLEGIGNTKELLESEGFHLVVEEVKSPELTFKEEDVLLEVRKVIIAI